MYGEYNEVLYDIKSYLEDISGQQAKIIENQNQIISGDSIFYATQSNDNNLSIAMISVNALILFILMYSRFLPKLSLRQKRKEFIDV